MPRNAINLLIAGAALLLVAGCFCRSDRPADVAAADEETVEPVRDLTSPGTARNNASGKKDDLGDFVVRHSEIATERYRKIDGQIRNERLLEDAADRLNSSLSLPHDITLEARDCGETNAFFDPGSNTVTMCYELMERFYKTFRTAGKSEQQASEKMFSAVRFVFLHEIGHALIDAYQLPIAGGEEDAADRLAAFVNLRELGQEGVDAVFAAAEAFAIESRNGASARRNLADEHLLQEQRFYNSLCMIYGSNAAGYESIVTDGYLPPERAARCRSEFQRTVQSWVTLLEPWRKN